MRHAWEPAASTPAAFRAASPPARCQPRQPSSCARRCSSTPAGPAQAMPPTCRLSTRSVLLPTSTMMTSLPRSARTSSTHRWMLRKDCRPATEARQRARGVVMLPGGRTGRPQALAASLAVFPCRPALPPGVQHLVVPLQPHCWATRPLQAHPPAAAGPGGDPQDVHPAALRPGPAVWACTHWSHRTPPLPRSSLECNWGSGCGNAPAPPCPCTAAPTQVATKWASQAAAQGSTQNARGDRRFHVLLLLWHVRPGGCMLQQRVPGCGATMRRAGSPQLQPHCPVFKVHCLGKEVDSNRGLQDRYTDKQQLWRRARNAKSPATRVPTCSRTQLGPLPLIAFVLHPPDMLCQTCRT